MIRFVALSKKFGEKVVLSRVSFEVKEGEVLFVIGASGVGKSVLIKHLVGLIRPDEGEIWLDGEEVTRKSERELSSIRKRCAMVFQHATLFDGMTCRENVALPLRKHERLRPKDALARADELLGEVHMGEYAHHYPRELGDGMRKRVAIARALSLRPETILFDEPTTSLDPVSARRVDRLIRELSTNLGVTSIVVSHDLASIFSIADRIVMLYQGKVLLEGDPAIFRASHDPIVRQFVRGEAEGPMDL